MEEPSEVCLGPMKYPEYVEGLGPQQKMFAENPACNICLQLRCYKRECSRVHSSALPLMSSITQQIVVWGVHAICKCCWWPSTFKSSDCWVGHSSGRQAQLHDFHPVEISQSMIWWYNYQSMHCLLSYFRSYDLILICFCGTRSKDQDLWSDPRLLKIGSYL